ncbi:MAG: hypothetical protein BGO53_00865 [Sphingobacteriales bacterium 39-19]|nr:glycosyltransferase family 2 protein [Sphingobacteriales bacterium]OJW08923.1 MAG: hypothetical protein BGO53_00865 [Sphingobacteriales bacterium 39-19]
MPIVSVIIPVFNEEKRIEQCISSIQNQTLKDLEIIVVNDGSTDHSQDIIKRLSELDNRVKLFNYSNGGAAFALSMGLQNATGKYIGFSGADDWIKPQMFEKMVNRIETDQTDLVMCNIQKEWENKIQNTITIKANEITGDRLLQRFIAFEFDYSICNKLYKKEYLNQYKIDFAHEIRIGQDVQFNLEVFSVIHNISLMTESFYHYVAKPGSLMSSPPQKRIISFNQIIHSFEKFCKTYDFIDQWNIFKDRIGNAYQSYFFNLLLNSAYTKPMGFIQYYRFLLNSLPQLHPLLIPSSDQSHSLNQKFKNYILRNKQFKIFSFLSAVRHKLIA